MPNPILLAAFSGHEKGGDIIPSFCHTEGTYIRFWKKAVPLIGECYPSYVFAATPNFTETDVYFPPRFFIACFSFSSHSSRGGQKISIPLKPVLVSPP